MHPLLAKVIGLPAVLNWTAFLNATEKTNEALRKAAESAINFETTVNSAREDFFAKPSADAMKRWIIAASQRETAQRIQQDVLAKISSLREEALHAGVAKLQAAIEEVDVGLAERAAEIEAEDRRRSEQLGEEVESTAALMALAKKRDKLQDARDHIGVDIRHSASALQTVLG
jgi:hypothetical protein